MALRFNVTTDLPATGCTQQDVYNTIETIDPVAGLVGAGMQLLGGQVVIADSVPYWRKYTKTFSDFSTGATSNDVELFLLSAGGVIQAVKIKHSTSFTGGAISAYTISVGISGTLNKYLTAGTVFDATSATNFRVGATIGSENFTTSVSIRAAAISTGANLNAATAGSVDIWVLWAVPPTS